MTVTTPQIQDGTARTEDATNIHWQFVQKFRPAGLLSCSNTREQTGQVHRMVLPSFAKKGRAEKRVRPYKYSIIRIVRRARLQVIPRPGPMFLDQPEVRTVGGHFDLDKRHFNDRCLVNRTAHQAPIHQMPRRGAESNDGDIVCHILRRPDRLTIDRSKWEGQVVVEEMVVTTQRLTSFGRGVVRVGVDRSLTFLFIIIRTLLRPLKPLLIVRFTFLEIERSPAFQAHSSSFERIVEFRPNAPSRMGSGCG